MNGIDLAFPGGTVEVLHQKPPPRPAGASRSRPPQKMDSGVQRAIVKWLISARRARATWTPTIGTGFDFAAGPESDSGSDSGLLDLLDLLGSLGSLGSLDSLDQRRATIVDRCVAAQRAKSRAEAEEAAAIAEYAQLVWGEHARRHRVADDELTVAQGDLARRDAAAELAAATRISPMAAANRIERCRDLVNRFPAVHEALAQALITTQQANVIREEGTRITDDRQRGFYGDAAIEIASSTAHTRLRSRCANLAELAMPETRQERHERARADRRIEIVDKQDGMCEFIAHMPTVLAAGIHDRLLQAAKQLKGPDEPRTSRQIMTDVFCELALTGTPAPRDAVAGTDTITGGGDTGAGAPHACLADLLAGLQARVNITIPVLSLFGAHDAPATINGMTPIPLSDAMTIARASPSWTRVLTDPMTGAPLAVDTYRPNAEQQAFLEARDQHCRFPGCRRPARRCDIDHTLEWAKGGATDIGNLENLCRGHHVLRHATPWHVEQERGGKLVWTAPSGKVYRDEPPPSGPVFAPSDLTKVLERARARGRGIYVPPGGDPPPSPGASRPDQPRRHPPSKSLDPDEPPPF